MTSDVRLTSQSSFPPPGESLLSETANDLDEVVQRVSRCAPNRSVDEITAAAVRLLRPAGWASVTLLDRGHFQTLAPTGDLASRTDDLQYAIGSGPCVDAALEGAVYVTGDLARDERWPEFGSRAAAELGVHSMLAYRLSLPEEMGAIAGLNIYSRAREGFDDDADSPEGSSSQPRRPWHSRASWPLKRRRTSATRCAATGRSEWRSAFS